MPNRRVERDKVRVWPRLSEAWWIAILPFPPIGFAVWLALRGETLATIVMLIMSAVLGTMVASLLSPRGTSLELRADGIEARTMGRSPRRYLWTEIEAFACVPSRGGPTVGWLLRPGAVGRRGDVVRRLVGADVVLPSYLCGDVAALARLLEAAQSAALGGRWAAFIAEQSRDANVTAAT